MCQKIYVRLTILAIPLFPLFFVLLNVILVIGGFFINHVISVVLYNIFGKLNPTIQ